MGKKTWFKNMLEEFKDDFDFRLESLILGITDDICKEMEAQNITKSDLARRLEISPAAVTKILNGNANFTLKSILKIAMALDTVPIIGLSQKQPDGNVPQKLPMTTADDTTFCKPTPDEKLVTA
jgi:DNA-binding Xre family transcriptional regulator